MLRLLSSIPRARDGARVIPVALALPALLATGFFIVDLGRLQTALDAAAMAGGRAAEESVSFSAGLVEIGGAPQPPRMIDGVRDQLKAEGAAMVTICMAPGIVLYRRPEGVVRACSRAEVEYGHMTQFASTTGSREVARILRRQAGGHVIARAPGGRIASAPCSSS